MKEWRRGVPCHGFAAFVDNVQEMINLEYVIRDDERHSDGISVRRDHLTMDISDDEKGRIIPLWIVNYLIDYIYPDDILLVGTIRLSKCI